MRLPEVTSISVYFYTLRPSGFSPAFRYMEQATYLKRLAPANAEMTKKKTKLRPVPAPMAGYAKNALLKTKIYQHSAKTAENISKKLSLVAKESCENEEHK